MAIVISGVNNNDKITASDGTIDLLSGVSYESLITAPAFTTPGNLTSGHINVGSNIQLGNAGIITATTFIGNLTGNVNNTGNLLLQIGGSEKFRVGGSGQLGIGGANYGTSGQVLTSGGASGAATWSTVSGTTINSNADNRIITGSSSANTLNGEANLTFDGSVLTNTGSTLISNDIKSSDDDFYVYSYKGGSDGQVRSGIHYDGNSQRLKFFTGTNERLKIDTGGRLLLNDYTNIGNSSPGGYDSKIQIRSITYDASISLIRNQANAGGPGIIFGKSRGAAHGEDGTSVNAGDNLGSLYFYGADGTDLNNLAASIHADCDSYGGSVPGSNDMPGRLRFATREDGTNSANSERVRINRKGQISIGNCDNFGTFSGQSSAGASGTMVDITNGTSSASYTTMVRLRGGSSGYVHASLNLCATSDNNSGNYRGLGIYMNDEAADNEWYAGRPYSSSNQYMIAYTGTVGNPYGATASTNYAKFTLQPNGNYNFTGSNTSDRDLKENIMTLSGTSLDKIIQLTPKTFNFKPQTFNKPEGYPSPPTTETPETKTGFIAQEVQSVIPSIVNGTDGQKDMGIDYNGLIAHMVNAIKELKAEIDALKS